MSKKYLFLGKEYELAVRLGQKNIVELADKIYLGFPNSKNADAYILTWYKEQARKVIRERTNFYSRVSGLNFNSVTIGNTAATTRWGSCSSQKNLNFNWKLIMAPLPVIDYVVAHELAHLKELNHSRDFWETVRKMHPVFREYRTWLKRHGHELTF